MSKFRVGDVRVGIGFVRWPECNGMECVIKSALIVGHTGIEPRSNELWSADAHLVQWANGQEMYARPQNLRLKRPPTYPDQFTAGDWDLTPWRPGKKRVEKPAETSPLDELREYKRQLDERAKAKERR